MIGGYNYVLHLTRYLISRCCPSLAMTTHPSPDQPSPAQPTTDQPSPSSLHHLPLSQPTL